MSAYFQIFIRTDKCLQQLAADLTTASGAEVTALDSPTNTITYSGRIGDTVIEIEPEHDFDASCGMDFTAYPLVVTVRELNVDNATKERVARSVFDKLASIEGYDMLLVFDLQRRIAQT